MSTSINFHSIRHSPKSQNDSFEDLSAVLFAQATKGGRYARIRGAGGDGGVEATVTEPSGRVHGMQAKYFFKLGSSEFSQIKESLATARSNYPDLVSYTICIPFDLTGPKAAGKGGQSELERFNTWKAAEELVPNQNGGQLTIALWSASILGAMLTASDPHGGRRLYWFDNAVLTPEKVAQGLRNAQAFAGPRFTAGLDVVTAAHDTLDVFGGLNQSAEGIKERLEVAVRRWLSLLQRGSDSDPLSCLEAKRAVEARALLEDIKTRLSALVADPNDFGLLQICSELLSTAGPMLAEAEATQLADFCAKHGADKDTPSFRQWQAEYMCAFPAAALDTARDLSKLLAELSELLESPILKASSAKTLLMVGPAGIGKTHSLVSSALRRLEVGAFSLITFGEDFAEKEPWQVIRTKLGLAETVARDELYECLDSAANQTGFPFILFIDALNETPGATKWKRRLPELIAQLEHFAHIKLCVSTRDAYLNVVFDERFPGLAFSNVGLAGSECVALEAFCTYYGIRSEITPLFASELSNPLFLHLACKAVLKDEQPTLDVSLPGFVGLFDSYMRYCSDEIKARLGTATPVNVVRRAMIALADAAVESGQAQLTRQGALAVLRKYVEEDGTAPTFLDALAKQGLVTVSETTADEWVVRFAFQRYFDVLRAMSLVDRCRGSNSLPEFGALNKGLEPLVEDSGFLEALAVVLPESLNVELTHPDIEIDGTKATAAFAAAFPMRSRRSIGPQTVETVRIALQTQDVWQAMYEALFRVSLVPTHPTNADFLSSFLSSRRMVDRDPFFSHAALASFERRGGVFSVFSTIGSADLSRWSAESRRLCGVLLSWLCGAADRRVRDRASRALTQLFGADASVVAPLIVEAGKLDDDYIKERTLLAAYSALLLNPQAADKFVPVLDAALSPGFTSPNVVVTDCIRLLADVLAKRKLGTDLGPRLAAFLANPIAPASWPTKEDVKSFLDQTGLPPGMKLFGPLAPDFARYIVDSRACSRFDLASSGITCENICAWIVGFAELLGYPGAPKNCLAYDHEVLRKHGYGRAKPAYAETLGKKYYWIALHRVVGLLNAHVRPAKDYAGRVPRGTFLWSRDLRDIDLTDMRDVVSAPAYPLELLAPLPYDFASLSPDDAIWVADTTDIPTLDSLLFATANDQTKWVALERYRKRAEPRPLGSNWSSNERELWCRIETGFVPRALAFDAEEVSLVNSALGSQGNDEYRGFIGEYPDGAAFAQAEDESELASVYRDGKRHIEYSRVTLLRGPNWEYDCSSDGEKESVEVPSKGIIQSLGLTWDRHSGWLDADRKLAVVSLTIEGDEGLFIRHDLLDKFLASTRKSMVVYMAVGKVRLGSSAGPMLDYFSYANYKRRLTIVTTETEVL